MLARSRPSSRALSRTGRDARGGRTSLPAPCAQPRRSPFTARRPCPARSPSGPRARHRSIWSILHRTVLLLGPLLGFDGRRIRQFLVQAHIEFFARDFGRKQTRGNVGRLVCRIKPVPSGIRARTSPRHLHHPSPFNAEIMNTSLNTPVCVQLLRQRQQLRPLDRVHLVEHQRRLACRTLSSPRRSMACRARRDPRDRSPARRIDDDEHRIGIARAGPGRFYHGAIELAPRSEDPGRVDEHDLRDRPGSRHRAPACASSALSA